MDLKTIKNDIDEGRSKMIYYSSKTLWWTHLDSDLEDSTKTGKGLMIKRLQTEIEADIPEGQKKMMKAHLQSLKDSSIPLDPTGAPLMQISEPKKWISEAEENPKHFGKHGLSTFLFSHHQNCNGIYPDSWDFINAHIDNMEVRECKDEEE